MPNSLLAYASAALNLRLQLLGNIIMLSVEKAGSLKCTINHCFS